MAVKQTGVGAASWVGRNRGILFSLGAIELIHSCTSSSQPVIINSLSFISTVDRMGRKFSLLAMFFLCFTSLLPLVFNQPQGITTGLLFGARICITANFTVVYIYAPEVSHDKIVLASSHKICKFNLNLRNFCSFI